MAGLSCALRRLLFEQDRFDQFQVFFGVDAYGVEVGGLDVKDDVVFEEA